MRAIAFRITYKVSKHKNINRNNILNVYKDQSRINFVVQRYIKIWSTWVDKKDLAILEAFKLLSLTYCVYHVSFIHGHLPRNN